MTLSFRGDLWSSDPDIARQRAPEKPMIATSLEKSLTDAIRTIPDYPKPGIMFRDITTLLSNLYGFRAAVDELAWPAQPPMVAAMARTAAGFTIFENMISSGSKVAVAMMQP